MKKGLKFTKEQLENLYLIQKLSLNKIGERYDCNGTNILYWLKKFNIKRRPAYYRKIHIPKRVLEELYWRKGLSSSEIARRFGIKNGGTIIKKLKRYSIKRKTVSEALTVKYKAPFTGNLLEKAYFLGLRTGDFHAKWARKSIRVQTTTTHSAQVELLRKSFEKYGETCKYLSKNEQRDDEWFIYVDLDSSFRFLLNKPENIPNWILENDDYFYTFLAAYIDCEGNWNITKSHEKHVRFTLRIRTGDKMILKQIKNKLQSKEFFPLLTIERRKGEMAGYGIYNKDIYNLSLNRKGDVIYIIKKLLVNSKHNEKIRKMNFIFSNIGKSWIEIEQERNKIRGEIKEALLKNQITKI